MSDVVTLADTFYTKLSDSLTVTTCRYLSSRECTIVVTGLYTVKPMDTDGSELI